jgi:predicted nucleotidyltransferase
MQCVEQKTSSPGVRIFKAIERDQVLRELGAWAAEQRSVHPQVRKLGLFGSYATGRYAPGSDIDLLVIVAESDEPRWFMRGSAFETTELSVGADLFVYTEAEAARLTESSAWFRHILQEVVWL